MSRDRLDVVTAVLALAAVALGAGLEGGTEPRMGAIAWGMALLAALTALPGEGLPSLPRGARWAVGVLAALLVLQVVPFPHFFRACVAPGQSALLDRVSGPVPATKEAWLTALAQFDISLLLQSGETYTFDPLAGGTAPARALALSAPAWAWQTGQWAAAAALVLVGWRLGRTRGPLLTFLVGLVGLSLLEAFFGFSNRNGPSTGIGTKVAYLGSATGTFINRGHFAAFLTLGLGALWGTTATLFPLLPDEVRKHQARKRRSSQPPGVLEASGDRLPRLVLATFTAAVLFVGLVAANSRAPLLSLLVAALGVGAWTRWRRDDGIHLRLGLAAPVAGVVFATFTLGPRAALGRFLTLGSADISVSSRLDLWLGSFETWLDAPVFGAGAGAWRWAFGPHERVAHLYDVSHGHSEPLEILVELGLVGVLALAVLGVGWLRSTARRIDVVDHDLRSSVGIGACVPLLAILLQSLVDFPLRTPGVLIPFAILIGISASTLDIVPSAGRRVPGLVLVAFAAITVAGTGLQDAARDGRREVRMSEMSAYVELSGGPAAAACAAAAAEPFNPWTHAACAVTTSRAAAAEQGGDDALIADAEALRALTLHPRDPRLQVAAAGVWTALREATSAPLAMEERATVALAAAVRADGWRAESAFVVAKRLSPEAVDRVGGAASTEPVSRARALYQYGIVVEEFGNLEAAKSIEKEAAEADPQFGPPAFRAGLLEEAAGDPTAAERWFRAFLAARDRPAAMEGWTLVKLGELDAAEVRFRRAVAGNPKNRWAWEGLAAVARARADVEAEREVWRRVLEVLPGDAAARSRLDALNP